MNTVTETSTSPSSIPVPPKSPITTYVVCAMIMSLLGTLAVMGVLLLRPDKDNTQLVTTILVSLAPTTAAIIGLIKIQEVHVIMNSRLDQLVLAKESVAKTEGRDEARAQAEAQTEAVTAAKTEGVV
jgi:hypothetical protein